MSPTAARQALLAASVATVFTVLAAAASLTSRPQLVCFVLLPVVLAAWLQTERDLKPRWWLVPLMWVWSLCHGFWFLGAGLRLRGRGRASRCRAAPTAGRSPGSRPSRSARSRWWP